MNAEPFARRVFAIVPAAGRSRRMGAAKQLMDVGGRTMIAAVVEPLLESTVAGVVVVTSPDIAPGLPAFEARAVVALIEDPEAEMIDSVRCGLRVWRERGGIGDQDGFLVCPADQPGITVADFDRCITAFRDDPSRVVVASRQGKRGHPLIFPMSDVAFVCGSSCDHGLHALPRTYGERVRPVECASVGVTRDIDTRDDYARKDLAAGNDGSPPPRST